MYPGISINCIFSGNRVSEVQIIVEKENFPEFEWYATRVIWARSFISSAMPKIGYNMRKILAGKSDPHKLGFTVLNVKRYIKKSYNLYKASAANMVKN